MLAQMPDVSQRKGCKHAFPGSGIFCASAQLLVAIIAILNRSHHTPHSENLPPLVFRSLA